MGWRWIYYILLPLSVLLLPLPIIIQNKHNPKTSYTAAKRIDFIGFILLVASAVCMLALQWGGSQYPWSSGTIIGLFVAAGVSLVALWFCKYRFNFRRMLSQPLLTAYIAFRSRLGLQKNLSFLLICSNR